jgi:REP element-mobilizing transposase RayT
MSRKLRYMHKPVATFEVTTRTLQSRLLLRPSTELNEIILGVLGKALELYPVMLHLVVVASNHIHMLITTKNAKLLSDFMRHVNSNVAREAGKLHRWREKFWGRRFTALEIEDDDELIKRAAYLLSHGCKEGLVLRPGDWPGVNCVEAVTRGKSLSGIWYDRTKEYEAERAGQEWKSADFAKRYPVPLSPLPCFCELDEGQQRSRYREMIREIERQTQKQFARAGRRVMGVEKVMTQSAHRRPRKTKRSPAPMCHCSDPEQWKKYRDDYRWFVSLYREASRLFRAGDTSVRFPPNCFPPPAAFTGADPPE